MSKASDLTPSAIPAKARAAAPAGRRNAKPAVAPQGMELASVAEKHTLAGTPLLGVRPVDLLGAAGSLLKAVGRTPFKAGLHTGNYLKALFDIAIGDCAVAPHPKDKRFADPAWQDNAFLRALMRSYLAGDKALSAFIEVADLGPLDKGRARFIASLLVDAVAPSNLLLTNPAALRKLVDTGGMNLIRGARQFSSDLLHNRGMPAQVDSTPFKLGENIATAKGEVVLRSDMFELLQYAPTTANVHARPLVMSPPQINKYYAIDLAPDKSLIKWMQDSGVQLFVISWRNPTKAHRDWGLAEYALCLDQAVEAARQITGESIDLTQVKVGAYVIGGTTDHITPWQGCYGTARLFGEDSTFVLSNAGHLQSLVNPPGNPKSHFYAAAASASDPQEWLEGAGERHGGSWWPHWRQWIQARSGDSRPAPKKLGSRQYPPLCATPGTYVLQR